MVPSALQADHERRTLAGGQVRSILRFCGDPPNPWKLFALLSKAVVESYKLCDSQGKLNSTASVPCAYHESGIVQRRRAWHGSSAAKPCIACCLAFALLACLTDHSGTPAMLDAEVPLLNPALLVTFSINVLVKLFNTVVRWPDLCMQPYVVTMALAHEHVTRWRIQRCNIGAFKPDTKFSFAD